MYAPAGPALASCFATPSTGPPSSGPLPLEREENGEVEERSGPDVWDPHVKSMSAHNQQPRNQFDMVMVIWTSAAPISKFNDTNMHFES